MKHTIKIIAVVLFSFGLAACGDTEEVEVPLDMSDTIDENSEVPDEHQDDAQNDAQDDAQDDDMSVNFGCLSLERDVLSIECGDGFTEPNGYRFLMIVDVGGDDLSLKLDAVSVTRADAGEEVEHFATGAGTLQGMIRMSEASVGMPDAECQIEKASVPSAEHGDVGSHILMVFDDNEPFTFQSGSIATLYTLDNTTCSGQNGMQEPAQVKVFAHALQGAVVEAEYLGNNRFRIP